MKVLQILFAAVIGAFVFDGLLLLADATHDEGRWADIFGWIVLIPTMVVAAFIRDAPNAYLVNAVFGAFVFSAVATFWVFVIKPLRKLSNEGK